MARDAVTPELQHEIERFLYVEAQLLDERRFEEWHELLADDLHYWVPTRRNLGRRELTASDVNGPDDLAHFDDTKQTMQWRIARLRTGFAWAEQPPSRTRRLVSNVRIENGEDDGELLVHSNFLLYCNRYETHVELFAGERRDVLRERAAGGWSIARRTVILDQTAVLADSISVLF